MTPSNAASVPSVATVSTAATPTTATTAPVTGLAGVAGQPSALVLEGVCKEYPGTPPVRVLHDVNLIIGAGELAAVVGPSGSGKSTLLALMGALDRPSSGTIRLSGYDLARLGDRHLAAVRAQWIGFVFQQFFLLPGVDAVENVAAGLLYSGLPARQRRERAVEALDAVGMGHRRRHQPAQLSGGERQRVAIARAYVGRPRLLLADEPTGALDTSSGAGIMQLLRELNAAGTTIVVITHDRELAASLPRRIGLRDGRIGFDERTGS